MEGQGMMIDEDAVSKNISPEDQMFSATYGREGYFYCGRSAAECIEKALDIALISPDQIKRVLDLPCGHGRVLRYLKVGFPCAEITACDLLRDGVDYCSSTFGAVPLYSCQDPEAIPLESGYFDLVWVGSLFTHLDVWQWPRFLAVLRNSVRPGGLLVFTTHGREAYRRMLADTFDYGVSYWQRTMLLHRYERAGFGYVQYPGSGSSYGLALSHPAWVTRTLTKLGGLRIVNFSENSWVTFQDVFACVREPEREADTHRVSKVKYLGHCGLDRMNPSLRSALWRIWSAWHIRASG
jgi:SAM-dependent methyltransferase